MSSSDEVVKDRQNPDYKKEAHRAREHAEFLLTHYIEWASGDKLSVSSSAEVEEIIDATANLAFATVMQYLEEQQNIAQPTQPDVTPVLQAELEAVSKAWRRHDNPFFQMLGCALWHGDNYQARHIQQAFLDEWQNALIGEVG